MYALSTLALAALLSIGSEAKICQNITIPVNISARTGIYNVPPPVDQHAVTGFAQNFTRQGGNYSEEAFTGFNTTTGSYSISAKYCKPSNGSASGNGSTVQFLTHGIGFDKT